jgi:transcriptional regulator with XRE-family HTH domain
VFAIASAIWFTVGVNPVNVGSIGEYIRQQREQAKISLRQLSSAAGVSNPYLSQIERGLRRPSAEILQQIAKGLRISAEALYVQAGILEDRRPDSGVRAAVLADPELTERQKQVLLDIYESFRRELAARADDADPEAKEPSAEPGPDGEVGWAEVIGTAVASDDAATPATARGDAGRADPGRADPGRADPGRADPGRADPSGQADPPGQADLAQNGTRG